MRIDIPLHGEKAERFREIRREMEEHRGYEPSRPEVVGELMRRYAEDRQTSGLR